MRIRRTLRPSASTVPRASGTAKIIARGSGTARTIVRRSRTNRPIPQPQAVPQRQQVPISKDCTTDIVMASVVTRRTGPARAATASASSRSRRVSDIFSFDFVLLASALFLQRFSLSFGHSLMSLDVVPTIFILIYMFASGRLLIIYDRLLWFLALGLAVTYSLYSNFSSGMLPSYSEFIVIYFLFTLGRPSTKDRYKSTLEAFQILVLILSLLAIAQFFAQFFIDGRALIQFFDIFPDWLLASSSADVRQTVGGVNTIIPISEGSSLIKSNGLFLVEPSTLSQITALGILIELMEFSRARYLICLAFGFLLSYSGTGMALLLLFLPLTGLFRGRALIYGLFVVAFAIILVITGVVDISVFMSRLGEFTDPRGSGFVRFIGPFWLVSDYLHWGWVRQILFGNGPGTTGAFAGQDRFWYSGGMTGTWIKLLYEYGLIGSFVFILFLAACFRRTFCPLIIVGALLFTYVFLGGNVLSTPYLALMIVLLTLNWPDPRTRRVGGASHYRSVLAPRSVTG
jgi:hypothetical protein